MKGQGVASGSGPPPLALSSSASAGSLSSSSVALCRRTAPHTRFLSLTHTHTHTHTRARARALSSPLKTQLAFAAARALAVGSVNATASVAAEVAKIRTTKEALQQDAGLMATLVAAKAYGCVTKDEINARIQSFADAVPGISQEFWTNGGGPDGGPNGTDSLNTEACQAAFDLAVATLDAAYGYDGTVLFKPTLTTGNTTFRPTRNGALSYFIGTECLNLVGAPEDQFPEAGSSFYEYGFALNNYNGGRGFVTPTVWDPASFLYRVRFENCEAPVAMGPMCFTANGTEAGSGPCVDKTFGFNRARDGTVLITTHHSSSVVPSTTNSTTVTQ